MTASEKEQFQNILVIRLDKVGDLLLSTPFLRNLRECYPHSHIAVLVKPYTREVLLGNPHVDEIIVHHHGDSLIRALMAASPLRSRPWDMAVALSPTVISYVTAMLSGARERAGYTYSRRIAARLIAAATLTSYRVLAIDEALAGGEAIPHEVRQTFTILEEMGWNPGDYPLEVYPGREAGDYAAGLIGKSAPGKKLIGIHLSWKWLTPPWTAHDMLTFIRKVAADYKEYGVLVTYGPEEEHVAEEMERDFLNEGNVFFAGGLAFRQWAALIGRCSIFFSTDTGSLHCAAAMGVPTVCLYEKRTFTHCSQQWAPWKIPAVIIEKDDPSGTIERLIEGCKKLLKETVSHETRRGEI
ncbi:MAG: glycosyltransferase family 9 protein [Candidatus Eremiobacteraeota bacterium]|nr:glycosyltransferase family 9 protein [Candidatus Eremiobacteraeota bacterium]